MTCGNIDSIISEVRHEFPAVMANAVLIYRVDGYAVHAVSVMAGSSVVRSIFTASLPLAAPQLYSRLGIHWATILHRFLALISTSVPFLFLKFEALPRKGISVLTILFGGREPRMRTTEAYGGSE